jgi:hypothetical protein
VFTLDARGAASKLRDLLVVLFAIGPLLAAPFVSYATPVLIKSSSDAAYLAVLQSMGSSLAAFFAASIVADAVAIYAVVRRRAILVGVAFGLLGLFSNLLWTISLRPGLATIRSMKSFVPIVVQHVKGDQLCITGGINYELSYYYGAAVPDLKTPKCVYLLATPREVDAMTPEYRAQLKLVAKSNLIGGGGPPALYEISPEAAK